MSKRLSIFGLEFPLPRGCKRYVVVSARATSLQSKNGTYVTFAEMLSSSDDQVKALQQAAKSSQFGGPGCTTVVIDSTDGLLVV
jgi:hypothetical protein